MIKKENERDNQNSELKMEYDPEHEYSASGSDYGAEDDSEHKGSTARYSRSKAQQNLNKPKSGGVLSGQTKKGANHAAAISGAAMKQKATIKSGPV